MVIVESGGDKFYLDGYLKNNLDLIKAKIKNDFDFIIPVTGSSKVRIGKSCIAMHMARYLDPSFDISRVMFKSSQLMELSFKLKRGQAIVYDEARRGTETKRALEKKNQNLIDFFNECGQLGLYIFLVMPDFFELKKEIAVNRSQFLVNVYFGQNLQRGFFSFYDDRKKAMLYFKGKKYYNNYNLVYPNFRGRFNNDWVVDKDKYQAMKLAYIKELMAEDKLHDKPKKEQRWLDGTARLIKYCKNGNVSMTYEQISEVMDIPSSSIHTFLKENKNVSRP